MIAPVLFILGPVITTAGFEIQALSLLSNKLSYAIITASNGGALYIAISSKNIQLSIVFSLWTIAMGSMFFLH